MDKINKRVLWVEGDSHFVEIYKAFFEKENIRLSYESGGETLFETIKRKKPDVIIMDLLSSKMDGFDFLERLKKTKATKKIPVVVLTSIAQKEDVERATLLGANDYLLKSQTKPVDLINKIKNYLN